MPDFLDTGLLTHLLSTIVEPVLRSTAEVRAFANSTMRVLVLIEIVLFGLYFALGSETLESAIKKVLQIGFFQFLLFKFGWLADTVRDSLITVGLMAGGNQISIEQFSDPSAFVTAGMKVTSLIFTRIDYPWYSFIFAGAIGVMGFLCILVIMIAFVFMGWQVFFALVEFYFKTSLAVIFLPFGVLQQTQALARNAIDGVVASCVKLMVLAFISALVFPVVTTLAVLEDPSLTQCFSMMIGVVTMALLMWRGPAMAAALLGNSSAFDVGSTFLAPAATAISTMASAARLGSAAMGMMGGGGAGGGAGGGGSAAAAANLPGGGSDGGGSSGGGATGSGGSGGGGTSGGGDLGGSGGGSPSGGGSGGHRERVQEADKNMADVRETLEHADQWLERWSEKLDAADAAKEI